MTAASQHLTVGGLINFNYKLVCVPTTTKILSISAILHTTFRIKSPKKSTELKLTKRRTLLFELSAQRPVSEDMHVDTQDAAGNSIPPPPLPPKTPSSRFTAVLPSTPFQIVPPGGSVNVWITCFVLIHLCPNNTLLSSSRILLDYQKII